MEPCEGPYAQRAPSREEIATVLRTHQAWLDAEGAPNDARRANFRQARLSWADLVGDNLQEADLTEANLQEVNLFSANLEGASLLGARPA
jgi:uncharacterized protein YjbI with pentapeptide repeats